jgi:cytoskeleton protein RodZ
VTVELDNAAKAPSYDNPKRILPGRRLRAARELTHMTVAEVANHLRLDPQLINSLEDDKYDDLPGAAYVCGYLRSYARMLKLPENEIVLAFTQGQDIKAALIPENVNILPVRHPYKRLLQLGIVLILMVLIAAGFLWLAEQFNIFDLHRNAATPAMPVAPAGMQQQSGIDDTGQGMPLVATNPVQLNTSIPSSLSTVSTASADSVSSTATELPSSVNTDTHSVVLRLKYQADSWTDVQDVRGNQLVYRLVTKDSVLTLRGEAPLRVLLGYAKGVKVSYQGKPFDFSNYVKDDVAMFTIGNSAEEKI